MSLLSLAGLPNSPRAKPFFHISKKLASVEGDSSSTFFAYPAELRKIIYTTNAVESLNYVLRKVTKNRAAFPTDGAALKLLYMALKNHMRKWTMPMPNWGVAMNQFSILFKERVPE